MKRFFIIYPVLLLVFQIAPAPLWALDPNLLPGRNFDLSTWSIQLPINSSGDLSGASHEIPKAELTSGAYTNPASRLAFISFTTVSNGVQLAWIGGLNAWQFVERSSNIGDTNDWFVIYTNTRPTSVTNTLLQAGAGSAPNRFYRINARRDE